MMKLIYIANIRIPTEKAHGIQIMEMCRAFVQNNCEVELVVPRRINNIKEDPFDYYGIEKKFKITKLPCLDLVFLNFGKLGFLVQTISFLISAKFYLFFKKIDYIFTRESLSILFFKNIDLELHDFPDKPNFIKSFLFRKARNIIVLTKLIQNKLVELGVDANRILIARHGININEFDLTITKEEARKKLGLPIDKKIILYSGNPLIYSWKGGGTLFDLVKFLRDDQLLVIVGVQDNNLMLNRLLDSNRNNLKLIPRQPHNLMPYYFKAANILVLPNVIVGKNEGAFSSPLKLFEYMASRTPIVASDIPNIREVLNNDNSILVKSGDVEDLARGIDKALQEQGFAHKISEKAFMDVRDNTWQNRAKNIFIFIKNGYSE